MTDLSTEALSTAGVVIAATIAYFGVRHTARQSAKAQLASKEMENRAVDAEAYERARESYEAAIAQYLREIGRLQERLDSTTARIVRLNSEVLELEDARSQQRQDIEATIEQMVRQRETYQAEISLCKERVDRLRERAKRGELISPDDPDLTHPHQDV